MPSLPRSTALVPYSPGYVYQWIDTSNGMMYVGSHAGTNRRYKGSGIRFKRAYKKRPEAFHRIILYTGPWFREVEGMILLSVGAENNPQYYNLIGGASGFSWTEERIGYYKTRVWVGERADARRLAIAETNRKTWTGRNHSDSARRKIKDSWDDEDLTAQRKENMSKARKGKGPWRGTHNRWHVAADVINIFCRYCLEDGLLPEGAYVDLSGTELKAFAPADHARHVAIHTDCAQCVLGISSAGEPNEQE